MARGWHLSLSLGFLCVTLVSVLTHTVSFYAITLDLAQLLDLCTFAYRLIAVAQLSLTLNVLSVNKVGGFTFH